MLDRALERARARRVHAESDLFEFLAIPSVSALDRHRADVLRACDWIAGRLRRAGMAVEIVPGNPGGHPVICAEWISSPGRPTLTLYGHYDVQPPDPLEEWTSPPFEPVVRDGFVQARGASDDKGQLLAGIQAIEHALAAGGPAVNLRLLVEGEEEITGRSLPDFVVANGQRLATDYLFIADGHFVAPGMPSLLTALRGLLYLEIEARGARHDLHSGLYGGVAPNPLNTLAHVLAGLRDRSGRITVPGFYDRVRPPAEKEIAGWDALPGSETELLAELAVPALEGEPGYGAHYRRSARPTLDVHGIAGGFVEEGKKTVIPARAVAKVSLRLVPDQDPVEVLQSLRTHIDSLGTPGVGLTVRDLGHSRPVVCGVEGTGLEVASAAFEAAFGARPILKREGGSIPVAVEFVEALHPSMLVTGFGLPGDGLHAPNEKFSLDQYHRGTEMVLHLIDGLVHAHG
jgi:acetylornithine deacetylase/succinyl-diaminopimelate desuccinylase-like protein